MERSPNHVDLSIIIVNWNSKEYLRKCIASILAETHGIEFEIVVIDNASFDGCDQMLRETYPQVRYIQSDKNLGFAKANNAAFKVSVGRNILFLNPDTEFEGASVETLFNLLCSFPSAGAVGPKLLNSDKSVQTSCIQSFPTISNQILDSNALRTLFPRARLWGMKPLFTGNSVHTEVDVVSGACLMIKRSVFKGIGMFSPDFFMYSEDIDICFKVREAGWKTYYVPTAAVVHHGGGSSSRNSVNTFSSVMMLESRWRFFRKTRPSWYCWIYRFAMFLASIVRIGFVLFLWPARRLQGKGPSMDIALKKWAARMRWALGGEEWVRNY